MSKFLTANAIASFDSRVKHAYENTSQLRNRVTLATNVVGSTHRFNKIGKGMATKRVPQTDVLPMNLVHGNAVASIEDWHAPEYTDIFDKQKVNYSEQDQLASIIANAIGRREDQMIIDALDAASSPNTVAKTIGGNDGLNTGKLRAARGALRAKGVPYKKGDLVLVTTARALDQLLSDPSATNIETNVMKPLYEGGIMHWYGFDIVPIEDRLEGGLPGHGTATATSFAFHREAVGLAVGINFRTEVNYIAHKVSWLANGIFSGGAVAIDVDGIVEITSDDTWTEDAEAE